MVAEGKRGDLGRRSPLQHIILLLLFCACSCEGLVWAMLIRTRTSPAEESLETEAEQAPSLRCVFASIHPKPC